MSTWREMGDASTPPAPPANLPVWAPYCGGQTPHVWTDQEIAELRARWILPIWVNVNPDADAVAFAAEMLRYAAAHHFAHGVTLVIDTESLAMPQFIDVLDDLITAGGYLLMEYESKGPSGVNPATAGGRWIADWTGTPHLYPGSRATQYADAKMLGLPWDGSVVEPSVPLVELHPPVTHPPVTVHVAVDLPELGSGDRGQAVVRCQHLLLAWNPSALPGSGPDGIFGSETLAAARSFQRHYGLQADNGLITAATWAELLTG